jgi:integrase
VSEAKRRRRGAGEGGISKRSDGRYEATIVLGRRDGKPIRKSLYGRTKKEVQEKLLQAQQTLVQGMSLPDERQKVGAFLDRWLEDTARSSVRTNTYASYSRMLRLHVSEDMRRVPLAKLTPQHVQALLNAKSEGGMSPRSVQYLRAILRRALNQAVRWGLVARNAAALVDPPRVERPRVQPLNPDEARDFLAAVRENRLEALYTVAMAIGLRQGEALGLRWQDVDLEGGTLRVTMQLQRIDGQLTLVEPKTRESRRTLSLPSVAIQALRDHRVRQLEERLAAGDRWLDRGLVFCTSRGTPICAVNLSREYHRLLKRTGIRRIRFHDLRHTCATLLLVQGVAPRVIMDLLGHTQISTTMDTYAHVMPALQKEAAAKMDELLTALG